MRLYIRNPVRTLIALGDFVYIRNRDARNRKNRQAGYIRSKNGDGSYEVVTVLSAVSNETINVPASDLELIPVEKIRQALYSEECGHSPDEYIRFVWSYNSFPYKTITLDSPEE